MFHVPHSARVRVGRFASTDAYGNAGLFVIPSCEPGWSLALICSDDLGWEHTSVVANKGTGRAYKTRTPSWKEMHMVKRLCWDDGDTVVQYHPPAAEYVNAHPNCLHLWRPVGVELITPPGWMVGPRALPEVGEALADSLDGSPNPATTREDATR